MNHTALLIMQFRDVRAVYSLDYVLIAAVHCGTLLVPPKVPEDSDRSPPRLKPTNINVLHVRYCQNTCFLGGDLLVACRRQAYDPPRRVGQVNFRLPYQRPSSATLPLRPATLIGCHAPLASFSGKQRWHHACACKVSRKETMPRRQ